MIIEMEMEMEIRIEKFVQRTVRTAMRRLVVPQHMFEDLLQEARLAVLKLLPSYDGTFGASLESYCFRSVRQTIYNYVLKYRGPFSVKQSRSMKDSDYDHLREIQRGLKSPDTGKPERHIGLFPGVYEILDEREQKTLDRFLNDKRHQSDNVPAVLEKVRAWYEGQM